MAKNPNGTDDIAHKQKKHFVYVLMSACAANKTAEITRKFSSFIQMEIPQNPLQKKKKRPKSSMHK